MNKTIRDKVAEKVFAEIKDYLRDKAPEVKGFKVNIETTGHITVFMRKDKGPAGYDTITKTFENFEELTKFYGRRKDKKSDEGTVKKSRRSPIKRKGAAEGTLAKSKSKKR